MAVGRGVRADRAARAGCPASNPGPDRRAGPAPCGLGEHGSPGRFPSRRLPVSRVRLLAWGVAE